jgi:two-component system phosphate regulon response regulator OmpR
VADSGRILVVDDDADIRDMLTEFLSGSGFEVRAVESSAAMREELKRQVPDVVLLDIGLPGEDGLSLARYVREHHDIGIVMVTGAGELVDRIVGLEIGADDYVAKPFDPRELRARIRSVLRRYRADGRAAPGAMPESRPREIRFGRCVLRPDSRQFLKDDCEVALTAMEFDLLEVFASRPNRVLSRDQLLNLTMNRDWDPFDRSVDIRIARLRRKIEDDPSRPRHLKTVRGAGYLFVPDDRDGRPAV